MRNEVFLLRRDGAPMAPDDALHPFHIDIAQRELDDLHDRLDRTRWPDDLPGVGWERGVPTAYLRDLATRWRRFDWRAAEARLNELPQLRTQIDGQPVHCIHLRSPEPTARPLVLLHGWPSSPVEFQRVLAPLADPRGHGGDPADAVHVVVPSLPGYGFSTPVAEAGWGNLYRVAIAFAQLMARLGYDRYAVHGTDVGSGLAGLLAMVGGEAVQGVHLAGTVAAMPFGPPLRVEEHRGRDRDRAERFNRYQAEGLGYLHLQSTRPQTLAFGLTDSPVAQLAWIVEKYKEWTDPSAELPEEAIDRDQILTNASIYWFTRSGASSAHATFDGMQAWRAMAAGDGAEEGRPSGPPMGAAVYGADTTIRSLMDPTGAFVHWSEHDRGGHFPAMEVPDVFVADLRAFLRTAVA
jgi:epoxide hydrolase